MNKSLVVATIVSMLSIAHSSVAWPAVITNGGFETHDLSGWTTSGDTQHTNVCGLGAAPCSAFVGNVPDGAPHSGDNAAVFGPVGSGSLQQTLTTVAGGHYDVSFWVENCVDDLICNPNGVTVSWDGTDIFSERSAGPFKWTQFTFKDLVATADSTVLQFSGRNDPSFFLLDDISVSGPVPEPSTLSILVSILGGLLFAARRTPRN